MAYDPSKLFNRSGYIPLKDYLEDIRHMQEHGPWKPPLGWVDRLQLLLLSLVYRWSWYRDRLSIAHPHPWSPAYAILLATLEREHFFDHLEEVDLPSKSLYSYRLIKNEPQSGGGLSIRARGVARDRATALSKSIGEMIERGVCGFYNTDEVMVRASPAAMLQSATPMVYPPNFHRRLPAQLDRYTFLKADQECLMEWVAGINLITREKIYIPRQLVLWGRSNRDGAEWPLQHATSNGNAGYFTREGAVLRGLLEVIHRDAFLVHWLTKTAPPRLRVETLPQEQRDFISDMTTRGITLHILNTTDLPIPSICVVGITDHSVMPRVILAGAAAVNFRKAIDAALEEIMVISGRLEDNASPGDIAESEPFSASIDGNTRHTYWRGRKRLQQLQWLFSGPPVAYERICQSDLSHESDDGARLRACLAVLKNLGHDYFPVAYFPQHPILRELGYVVAQVFVPKAFPMYLREHLGTFDSDRLNEFAKSREKNAWTLNTDPHMFG